MLTPYEDFPLLNVLIDCEASSYNLIFVKVVVCVAVSCLLYVRLFVQGFRGERGGIREDGNSGRGRA